jgi:pSer/pThr/pTyr-binding forkhead associated (FHA) protein
VLGRDDSADIILDDPGISRQHSEIRVTNDGPHLVASIRDLNSTNGTFVNSERISSQRLSDGDRVTVGRTSVIYRAGRR